MGCDSIGSAGQQDLFWPGPLLHFILPHFCRNFAATFVICLLELLHFPIALATCTHTHTHTEYTHTLAYTPAHTVHMRKLLGQNICAMPGTAYTPRPSHHDSGTPLPAPPSPCCCSQFVPLVKRPEIWFFGISLAWPPHEYFRHLIVNYTYALCALYAFFTIVCQLFSSRHRCCSCYCCCLLLLSLL